MREWRIAVLSATLCVLAPPALARGDVNAMLGAKFPSQDVKDYGYEGTTYALGIMTSFWREGWPIAVAADLTTSTVLEAEGARWEGYSTTDVHLGARKYWATGRSRTVRPYVGGGIAVVHGELSEGVWPWVGETRTGTGLGLWLGGGVSWRLGKHFNLGIDGRFSRASVSLPLGSEDAEVDLEAGGFQVNAILGYGW